MQQYDMRQDGVGGVSGQLNIVDRRAALVDPYSVEIRRTP